MGKQWHCPWGFTVIDDVAPAFKLILEENYFSSSMFPIEDTKSNRTMWWMWRKELDCRLGKLLRYVTTLPFILECLLVCVSFYVLPCEDLQHGLISMTWE